MDLLLSHFFRTDLVDGMESDFHQKETVLYLSNPNQKYNFFRKYTLVFNSLRKSY
jgi:hypothetical protein